MVAILCLYLLAGPGTVFAQAAPDPYGGYSELEIKNLNVLCRAAWMDIQTGVREELRKELSDQDREAFCECSVENWRHRLAYADIMGMFQERDKGTLRRDDPRFEKFNGTMQTCMVEILKQAPGADAGKPEDRQLIAAAEEGDLAGAQAALEKGADKNAVLEGDYHALYIAAFHGHLNVVKLLVERGADVNKKSGNGRTPIFGAIFHKHLEIVEYLIAKGADVNVVTARGISPLDMAIITGDEKTQAILKTAGAKTASTQEKQ